MNSNTDSFTKVITESPILADEVRSLLIKRADTFGNNVKEEIVKSVLNYEKALLKGIDEFFNSVQENPN